MERDLRPLFEPRSVAIVGASNDPAKWGQWLARDALRGAHRRRIFLVNRRGGEVLGQPSYRSLSELPEPAELVVVAVPTSGFEETVDAALEAGTRAIVAITAGLGETGEDGRRREAAVVARVREAGAVLVGPNCLGVYDAAAELVLGTEGVVPGPIGFVSQSGNLGLEVSLLAADVGLGLSRFASVGNQADLDVATVVRALALHESTRVIAAYCEDFRDGREFARAAAGAGKPVLVLAGGASVAGARAAGSHTGALVSGSSAVDAMCRAAGCLRVRTPRELVELASVLLGPVRPGGKRLAVVSDGGGSAVVAADLAPTFGLELPRLSAELSGRLADVLPAGAGATNPVDFAGAGEQDLRSYERVPRLLMASREVDAVLLTGYLGGYGEASAELREPETDAARSLGRTSSDLAVPVIVQTMYWQSSPARALRELGVPVFRDVEPALRSLARAAGHELAPAKGVPDLPEPARPAAGDGYFDARELLAAAGVPFAPARQVTDADGAASAAAALGYPVVLKALGLLHKSDAGGVVLGLEDEAALRAAVAELDARLAPPGYAVERMVAAPGAVELIVGTKQDPRFGPVLIVGLGGLYAEVLRDAAVALAPAEPDHVEELLRGLAGAALLTGARGRAPLAVRAAAEAAAALSRVAAEHPELAEVEVNPLLVTRSAAIGLDARIVT